MIAACGQQQSSDQTFASHRAALQLAATSLGGQELLATVHFGTTEYAQLLPDVWGTHETAFKAPELTADQAASSIESAIPKLQQSGSSEILLEKLRLAAKNIRTSRIGSPAIGAMTDNIVYRKSVSAIIAFIDAKYPNFFSSYAMDMHSKDPTRISDAIDRSSKAIIDAVVELTEDPTKESLDSARPYKPLERQHVALGDDLIVVDTAVAAFNFAVVVSAAVVVVVAFADRQSIETPGELDHGAPGSTLAHDTLVASVARAF